MLTSTMPLIKCEHLKLHVDPNATPTAVHKPALVPIHWQNKVYEDLEREVRIGVLERVDPNTPTTWFSRMVVTCKADGTPRRTVDLQPQNRHSVRQPHHVPSPFHLADRVPQHTKKPSNRCMERVPFSTNLRKTQAHHNFHHTTGTLQVQGSPTGIRGKW